MLKNKNIKNGEQKSGKRLNKLTCTVIPWFSECHLSGFTAIRTFHSGNQFNKCVFVQGRRRQSIWHFVLVQFRSCAIRSFVTISFFSISSLRQIVLSRTKLQERNCKKERTNLYKTSTKFKMLHYLYPVIMLVKSINFTFWQLCHQ